MSTISTTKHTHIFYFDWFNSNITGRIRWGIMHASVPERDIRGIILLLNGRTEFMEKYHKTAARLSKLGYHVLSMDWRGQGLSVRELTNRHKGYVKDFNHYVKDLQLFYHRFVEPHFVEPLQLPVTIMAHSMGGHIALRYLIKESMDISLPASIEKAVLISPMLDIRTSPFPRKLAGPIADLAVKTGLGKAYIPGEQDYSRENFQFKNNPLTHDRMNFQIEHMEIKKNPDLALGGVTWGWLKAAFDSISLITLEKELSSVEIPVWIASADQDKVVCNTTQKKVCRKLSCGTLISIPGALHEILFETSDVQKKLWEALPL